MTLHAMMTNTRRKLEAFGAAENGNVAIIFGLAILPLFGLIGASIDYSRANSLKANMQAAVDSTALAVSKTAATQTSGQLSSSASTYFNTLLNFPAAQDVSVAASYSSGGSNIGSSVVVTANATLKSNYMGMMGFATIPVQVSSTTLWGTTKLRVALALDNTGSMASDGKMSALKTAATNLIGQLQAAAVNNGDVYVSIIPFSKDVNVGSNNWAANYIDWSGASDTWDENNGTCTNYRNYRGSGSPGTKSSCQSYSGTWTADLHATWNGCVTDRDQNFDITNTSPYAANSGSSSPQFPAEQYGYCPVSMMAMSYNWTALKSKISAMNPAGNTNQGIGLAWAWQSLTTGDPLNPPAKDSNYTYQDVIILMSDGLNTQNRWSTNQSTIDARQKLMCDNVKAAGVTLYTIHVNTDGDPVSTLLQNCASDTSKFYILTSASQLITAFNQIGTSLSRLRVAK